MGRATIISGGDEGKYRVRIKYDRRRADAEISKLQAEIPGIQAASADIVPEITQAENDLVYLHQVLSAKIHELGQTPPGSAEQSSAQSAVRGAKKDLDKQEMVLSGLRQERRRLEFEIARRETRIRFLETSIPEDREADAWCADYTENLTGDVGTIEPGRIEPDRAPTIMPGGLDGGSAAHVPARDGQLQPVNAGTAASAFYNYAILPGAARWRPRYRAGVIKSISGDTCTVDLDSLLLTHQRLSAGPAETLADVPIVYMDCNESAFETDDHVIVAFEGQDQTKPRVIGFVDNPRPCAGFRICLTPRNDNQTGNPALVEIKSGSWALAIGGETDSGNLDWKGGAVGTYTEMLTWHGPPGRYIPGGMADGTFGTSIFRRGVVFATTPSEVYGASVCSATDGTRWLLAVCRDGSGVSLYRAPYQSGVAGTYDPDGNPSGWRHVAAIADGWLSVSTAYTMNRSGGRVTGRKRGGWFFSGSGRLAVSMVWVTITDPDSGPVDIDVPVEISIDPDSWTVAQRWLLSWGEAQQWGVTPAGLPHGVIYSAEGSTEGTLGFGSLATQVYATASTRIWAVDYVVGTLVAVAEHDVGSTTWIDEDFGGAGGGHRATHAKHRTLTLSVRGLALPNIVLSGTEVTVDHQAPVDTSGDFTVVRTLARTRTGVGTGASVYFGGGDLRAGLVVVDCYEEWDNAASRTYVAEYELVEFVGHVKVSESDSGAETTNFTQVARAYLRGASIGQSSRTISTNIDGVLPSWILSQVRSMAWRGENYSLSYQMTTLYAVSANYRLFLAAANRTAASDAFVLSLAKYFYAAEIFSGWCDFVNLSRPGGATEIVPLPDGNYPRYWPIVPV